MYFKAIPFMFLLVIDVVSAEVLGPCRNLKYAPGLQENLNAIGVEYRIESVRNSKLICWDASDDGIVDPLVIKLYGKDPDKTSYSTTDKEKMDEIKTVLSNSGIEFDYYISFGTPVVDWSENDDAKVVFLLKNEMNIDLVLARKRVSEAIKNIAE